MIIRTIQLKRNFLEDWEYRFNDGWESYCLCPEGVRRRFDVPKNSTRLWIQLHTHPAANRIKVGVNKKTTPFEPTYEVKFDDRKTSILPYDFAKLIYNLCKLHQLSSIYAEVKYS